MGDYRCITLAAAKLKIKADGFRLGTVTPEPPGYKFVARSLVIAQNPAPDDLVPPGSIVNLTVTDPASYPYPTCPPPIP